jgi:hypothetical protein
MELTEILSIVTFIVTLMLGVIAKKSTWINDNLIPLQNLAIGVVVAIIEWIITKDLSVAIAVSGILAGGTYDIIHNLDKLREGR